MIHYTCDRCHRPIDPTQEIRYAVRIEVVAATGEPAGWSANGHDPMTQLDEMIERLDPATGGSFEPCQQQQYDLCSSCHDRFVRDPMGAENHAEVGFSEN